jgi:hypothetical protein
VHRLSVVVEGSDLVALARTERISRRSPRPRSSAAVSAGKRQVELSNRWA